MTFVFDDFSNALKNEVISTIPSWMMKETKSELWEEFDYSEDAMKRGFENHTMFMIQLAYVMMKKYEIEVKMTFSAVNFLRFADNMIPQEFIPMVSAMREEIACADFEEEMEDVSAFFAEHNNVRV